jgi:hypothetical protein
MPVRLPAPVEKIEKHLRAVEVEIVTKNGREKILESAVCKRIKKDAAFTIERRSEVSSRR